MYKNKQRYSEGNTLRNGIPTILVQMPSDDLPYADETEPTEEDGTGASPKHENPSNERRVSLRRNSISLPNLDEMQTLNEQGQISESAARSDFSNSENEITEDEEFYRPPRNARRKSVISPRMLRPPGDDESGTNSAANSITSVNSLASLLREKMQMFPATFKKKKNPDYKVKIFVFLLFIAIICIVSAAYALYQRKVLHRAYFEKIKLNKAEKIMKIYNSDGEEIVHARLGTTLNYEKVHPCLPGETKNDGSICFEWMDRARLYLQYYEMFGSVKCYNVRWISLSDKISPTDCFQMASTHWYGGGQTADNAWPLEKGENDFAPFITGRIDKNQWGNVLKRYFINSKGTAIVIDNKTPLHVSIRGKTTGELCLSAKYDDFAFVNHLSKTPELNYSICTNPNMFELNSLLTGRVLWDGWQKDDINIMHSLLSEPLWDFMSIEKDDLTQDMIVNFTVDVLKKGFKQGHVLINEYWQNQIGDFSVDLERFPSLQQSVKKMHRRGFRIVFAVQPFISTESPNFIEAVNEGLLISERSSDSRIPALTRYKKVQSAGVLDVTNNKTVPWLLSKLKENMAQYNFDAYYLDLGVAYDMPHYYHCHKPLLNPDDYKTIFVNSLQNGVNLFGVNSAIKSPRAPIFVSLPPVESSWRGLRRIIPSVLTYGMIGYPFLIPGAVGGDYDDGNRNSSSISSDTLPDTELYMRWMQLAAFLPVIRFVQMPSAYNDDKVTEMDIYLTSLRQKIITPMLKRYAPESLETGVPLVRPLWMLDAGDAACHLATDEFSIGAELIVAPVLHAGARQREVYLPAGVWRDGISGVTRKGSRWLHDYDVDLNEVAYFEKLPDDTRF